MRAAAIIEAEWREPAGVLSAWRLLAGLGRGRLLARVGAVVSLSCTAFFGWLWYQQYLKWDFNELGRYYDPVDQVVYTDSGFVWVLPAGALLVFGLLCAWRGWRR